MTGLMTVLKRTEVWARWSLSELSLSELSLSYLASILSIHSLNQNHKGRKRVPESYVS